MIDMDFLFTVGTLGMVVATVLIVIVACFAVFRKG
jgi:hypothetical protein